MRTAPDEARITLRNLTDEDIELLARWLADPDVHAWYREGEPTVENLAARYRPIIEGRDPTTAWIASIDGRPAGHIQTSRIAPDSEYGAALDLPPPYRDHPAGVDILLGEPRFRNGGWGPLVLRAFLRRILFGRWRVPAAIIAPELMNERAIHAYERAGFRWLKTVPIEDADPDNTEDEFVTVITDEYVMGVTRTEFEARFGSRSPADR